MILDTLAQATKKRIDGQKQLKSLEALKQELSEKAIRGELVLPDKEKSFEENFNNPSLYRFEKNLKGKGIHIIAEVKKASPSKGLIDPNFDYMKVARDYEMAGVDCVSCLTEPDYFKGSDEIFMEIRRALKTPMIRKDFTVDEYMIYQAKLMGADCILLICAILDDEALMSYYKLADSLGLSVLVETHDEEEMERALKIGARMIGVNNRNLKDFTVDIGNSIRLRKMVPENVIFVAESGIKTREDIKELEDCGTNGVLIGETFMRAADKAKELKLLKGEAYE
ncbi:MAG TPA: indole-3-glycerol phosphate synthase TrpC [Lachnospiraceae bacterium]|jgi:indole-3-glycerol phosphate synthase|nr:indole-3-glycerol phosphate synthase TrpC [Lachnospiraceae bacterium]HBR04468.1 indole-3-glycerol phosphate synthase TrpC [Lachnospiraceae bacterium]